jgi:hypothetical protein
MQNQANLPAIIEQSAKAQGIALANVTLIMPTETFGAVLGEFDKITLETVRIDTTDEREVYEPNGKGKGFALGKSSLQKVAFALSIQWVPRYTGIVESTAQRSRAKAVGLMRKPNGETITITEEKTIDLDVERENELAKAEKNSLGGRVVRWEGNRPVKEPWKSEAARVRWVELEIENAIKQKRRFKDELANTGAKDRVIRAFLALKSTYSAEELSKPLAFPRVVTDTNKLLANPLTRRAAIEMIGQATASLYGTKEEAVEPAGLEAPAGVVQDPGEQPMRDVTPPAEADPFADDAPPPPNPATRLEEILAALRKYQVSDVLNLAQKAAIQAAFDRGESDVPKLETFLGRVKAAYDNGKAS